jgi:hypothetical protein
MANFKNISEESLTVPRATGPITVKPGEVFVGSNVLLAGLVESGHLEKVTEPDPTPEPAKHRGRKAETGPVVGDIDHVGID